MLIVSLIAKRIEFLMSKFLNNKDMIRLKDIKLLTADHCKIKDPVRVERILNEFHKGGPERLQLVSDFDFTITKHRTPDGSPVLSTFGILNACPSLPQSFLQETKKLHEQYRPIEINPHIAMKDKIRYMSEWWIKTGELLVGFPLDLAEIDIIAEKYKDVLRDHTDKLLKTLNCWNVPVLIFSAGLGHAVVALLKQARAWYSNIKVVSNFLQYKNGLLNGFQEPIINTCNKNDTVLVDSKYYESIRSRDHIILLGDSIGDADMANGVPSSSQVLKIGFLYHHPEENLEKYMNAFDIVLIDDQTMDVPLEILLAIESNKQILETNSDIHHL